LEVLVMVERRVTEPASKENARMREAGGFAVGNAYARVISTRLRPMIRSRAAGDKASAALGRDAEAKR
jgi:hypothetical protein